MGTICLLRATIRFSFKNAGTVVAKQVKYAKGNRSDIDGKEKRRLKNRTILLMAPKESGSVSGGTCRCVKSRHRTAVAETTSQGKTTS
jgi:hypothetical protein